MQHQEFYNTPKTSEETPAIAPVTADERQLNTDPREQPQQETQDQPYSSYEEGYAGGAFQSYQGEKLRPQPMQQQNAGRLLAMIGLICTIFIFLGLFSILPAWISWTVVLTLFASWVIIMISNWRTTILPTPTQTFLIAEHARLVVNNGTGNIVIRQGEERTVNVTATKRTSGVNM